MKITIFLLCSLVCFSCFAQVNRPKEHIFLRKDGTSLSKWSEKFYKSNFQHCSKQVPLYFWQLSKDANLYKVADIGIRGYYEIIELADGSSYYYKTENCLRPKFVYQIRLAFDTNDETKVSDAFKVIVDRFELTLAGLSLRNIEKGPISKLYEVINLFLSKYKNLTVYKAYLNTKFENPKIYKDDKGHYYLSYKLDP